MTILENAVYERYITPIKRKKKPYVGVEFELPVVNLKKEPVDFLVMHALADAFVEAFAFTQIHRDDDGEIYMAVKEGNQDSISFDCSYNTLELSFGVEDDMNVLYNRFVEYYTYISQFLKPYHHTLTGMGINPHCHINQNVPISNERYRMLFHHLSSYPNYQGQMDFHSYPNFGLFSCANQVQLDVEEEHLVETINTFNRLEPLKALLFANSPWELNGNRLLCGRDHLWKNSLHGLNPHNVDMHKRKLQSVDDMVQYIMDMSLYCVMRDGKYINFTPICLRDYFAREQMTGEYFDGKRYQKIQFQPEISDLDYLRSFKFEDLTFRGTIEFRSACEQPVSEIMSQSAFQTGLNEVLPEVTELLEKDTVLYQNGYSAMELRCICNQEVIPDIFDKTELSKLLLSVLELAQKGLKKRRKKEEHFLKPLYRRAERVLSPGREMVEGIRDGKSVYEYIEQYAVL